MRTKTQFWLLLLPFAFAACTKKEKWDNTEKTALNEALNQKSNTANSKTAAYKAVKNQAAYITANHLGKMGKTVYFFNTGNKHLGLDYVPADPRRGN